jgi:N-acetylmuramoyl-L-alanine amidase
MRFGWLTGVRICGALLLLAVAAQFAAPGPALAQQLFGIPLGPGAAKDPAENAQTTRTRFIIGLERPVDFEVAALENPNRVFVDLPEIKVVLPDALGDEPAGLIKSFRHGMSAPGKSRVVIDVTGPVVVEKAVVEKPGEGKFARLVIDMVSADEATATAQSRATMRAGALGLGAGRLQPPTPKPAQSPQARAANTFKPVIVIDPGHGGDDGGATKFGTLEKDVVLSFSLKLREKLNATGRYRVLMTRETDVFVPLEDRREFAERSQAALFIAIHADYARRASARGATIYSLRPQLSESLSRAARGAVKENVLTGKETALIKKVGGDVNAVRDMLADLVQLDVERKGERTNAFVQSVLSFMGSKTNMMENPDRKAAFVVLQTTTVPSILLELGYLTSLEDAQQLKSDRWRDSVSGSLVTAIDNYFSNHVARLPL